jgi:hypothetical protein
LFSPTKQDEINKGSTVKSKNEATPSEGIQWKKEIAGEGTERNANSSGPI